jgi:hypothetical protein
VLLSICIPAGEFLPAICHPAGSGRFQSAADLKYGIERSGCHFLQKRTGIFRRAESQTQPAFLDDDFRKHFIVYGIYEAEWTAHSGHCSLRKIFY